MANCTQTEVIYKRPPNNHILGTKDSWTNNAEPLNCTTDKHTATKHVTNNLQILNINFIVISLT